MLSNMDVQKRWPESPNMDENKFPHVIEDIKHKDTNSHTKKMLQIPANEKRHTKLDSEKTLKRTRGKPYGGMYMYMCAWYLHTHNRPFFVRWGYELAKLV